MHLAQHQLHTSLLVRNVLSHPADWETEAHREQVLDDRLSELHGVV